MWPVDGKFKRHPRGEMDHLNGCEKADLPTAPVGSSTVLIVQRNQLQPLLTFWIKPHRVPPCEDTFGCSSDIEKEQVTAEIRPFPGLGGS